MTWRETISKNKQAASGFTLLELVLVLAVIAVAIAIVAPSLSGFARGRAASNVAGQFVAVARWARTQAITSGATYRLNVDPSANKWWLTSDNGHSFVQVDNDFGKEFTLPDGITMTTDAPKVDKGQAIEFDPSGRSDPTSVHFLGTKGTDITVACDTPADLYHIVAPQGGR